MMTTAIAMIQLMNLGLQHAQMQSIYVESRHLLRAQQLIWSLWCPRACVSTVICLWAHTNFFHFEKFHQISKIPKHRMFQDIMNNFDFWTPLLLGSLQIWLDTFSDLLHLYVVASHHLKLFIISSSTNMKQSYC